MQKKKKTRNLLLRYTLVRLSASADTVKSKKVNLNTFLLESGFCSPCSRQGDEGKAFPLRHPSYSSIWNNTHMYSFPSQKTGIKLVTTLLVTATINLAIERATESSSLTDLPASQWSSDCPVRKTLEWQTAGFHKVSCPKVVSPGILFFKNNNNNNNLTRVLLIAPLLGLAKWGLWLPLLSQCILQWVSPFPAAFKFSKHFCLFELLLPSLNMPIEQ